jgi:magnesium transporter
MESSPFGFAIALIISVLVSVLIWWIFRHKRLI